MRQWIALGTLGVGYFTLRTALRKRPTFHGLIAEQSQLIAWNELLMDCIQQVSVLMTESKISELLFVINDIRATEKMLNRSSASRMQQLKSRASRDIEICVSQNVNAPTSERILLQNSLLEDVVPIINNIFEDIQHNHMMSLMIT